MLTAAIPISSSQPRIKPALTNLEKTAAIIRSIKGADRDLRRCYPILQYQSALGLAVFLFSAILTVASSVLYLRGDLAWWVCLPLNAFFLSLIRELDHDLVHGLYFSTRKWAQNLMMFAVWLFEGNMPNPWYRRSMHLLHHRTTGSNDDFEERLIGNGMPFGPLKLLAMVDPWLALLFRQKELRQTGFYRPWEFFLSNFPVGAAYHLMAYGWVLLNALDFLAARSGMPLPESTPNFLGALDALAVIYVLPNFIRHLSMNTLASTMHYFGDVDSRLNETQVLNAWWTLPLQLFSCNFGATHSIHHFLVHQPFYLRLLVARKAHTALRHHGVRYNDPGTLLRANRFSV